MENKAMLPDSTQSETLPPTSSAASAKPLPSTRDGPSHRSSKTKTNDKTKKKHKRKSEDRGAKSSKKKKLSSKDKSHKEQTSAKKSKKENPESKKAKHEDRDSDLDMETELKPIRDYVKDREEMLQQMFRCLLKAHKLQAMLPDILQGLKVEELQQLCLLQLEGMSKTRIMSILAGEEMQSSSDDDESDLDPARPHPKSGDSGDEHQINSEVVDSTSSLPQATPSVGDAEEAESLQEQDKKAAGEEASVGDMDAEDGPEVEADEDDTNVDGSWHDDGGRQQAYYSGDQGVDDEIDEEGSRHEDAESSAASSTAGDDCEDVPEGEEAPQGEETVVRRAKKFRRVKIVRAEGEECEEGEITSDEVETDEESVPSCRGDAEGDPEDAEPQDTHPGAGDAAERLANSGNQGDDNGDNFVDTDDASAHVAIDLNVAQDVAADASDNVARDAGTSSSEALTSDNVQDDMASDSLNIFAEETLEMDTEEQSTVNVAENVSSESDSYDIAIEDADDTINATGHVGVHDQSENDNKSGTELLNEVPDSDAEIAGVVDDCANESDDGENVDSKNAAGVVRDTPDPAPGGHGGPGTAKPPGRKVAQQLEVLELELRARAIRSLMKQYGKDVG